MSFFNRTINVETLDEGENLRLKGTLRDERLDEPLHWIDAEMVISVWEGEILEISGHMERRPLEECLEGLESLEELLGVRIRPGFTDFVKQTVGSNRGCSHLAALIMTMANVSVQGRGAYIRKHFEDEEIRMYAMADSAQQLGILDSCVCWREDGPLVRHWRASHQRPDDA